MNSLGYLTGSWIIQSKNMHMKFFIHAAKWVCRKRYMNLYSHQQYIRISIFLQPFQQWEILIFKILSNLTGQKKSDVLLIHISLITSEAEHTFCNCCPNLFLCFGTVCTCLPFYCCACQFLLMIYYVFMSAYVHSF